MTDDRTIPLLLEDRDRLLEEIEKRDIRISELERAISLRVSIPIGFSSSLQHCHTVLKPPVLSVSIPIGFSSSLQLKSQLKSLPEGVRFNPYRVFKFVATSRDR